eukprot:5956569-Lingulodinium_polyedra.AAC.1
MGRRGRKRYARVGRKARNVGLWELCTQKPPALVATCTELGLLASASLPPCPRCLAGGVTKVPVAAEFSPGC